MLIYAQEIGRLDPKVLADQRPFGGLGTCKREHRLRLQSECPACPFYLL